MEASDSLTVSSSSTTRMFLSLPAFMPKSLSDCRAQSSQVLYACCDEARIEENPGFVPFFTSIRDRSRPPVDTGGFSQVNNGGLQRHLAGSGMRAYLCSKEQAEVMSERAGDRAADAV